MEQVGLIMGEVWLFRYKHEIRAEDKQQLHKLIRRQFHYLVTPEIHRELEASRCAGMM